MLCYNHCKIDFLVENIIVTLSFQFHFVIPLSFNSTLYRILFWERVLQTLCLVFVLERLFLVQFQMTSGHLKLK